MIFDIIAFVVFVVGIGLLVTAAFMDRKSSFDNASFMNEMAIGTIGVVLIGAAVVLKIIQLAFAG